MIDTFFAFLFTQYGAVGVAGFIAGFMLLKNYSSVFGTLKHVFKVMSHKEAYDAYDILSSKLAYFIDFKIQNIYLRDLGRREIFRDIIQIRYQVMKKHIASLNDNVDNDMSSADVYARVTQCLHDWIEESEWDAMSRGVPQVVVEKYRKWSSKNTEFALKAIEMVCFSTAYGDNEKRMDAIYSLFTAMLELTIAEAERSLNELNGELNGIEYKGHICRG